jgi:hypothetical protein
MTARRRMAAGTASVTSAAGARSTGATLLAAALVTVLAAGCGSTAAATSGPAGRPAVIRPSLVTSLTVPGGASWAVVDMGGSSAKNENFWQLLARPARAAKWSLATPPGVADNGGLVAASLGGPALVTGFNPSQDLTFSPLATSRDSGAHWTPGLLPAGLAALPSALAAGPGGRLIALTNRDQAEISAPGGTGWARLTSLAALSATPAGRSCGLKSLTAAAFSLSGTPLLAGQCAAPGVAGIFAYSGGSWHQAGPALPGALARRRVSVLRLATTGRRTIALLTATAPGGAASLTAASASASGRWTVSAPLPLGGAQIVSTATGTAAGVFSPLAATAGVPHPASAAGVILSTGRAETIVDPDGSWQQLPALPAHAAALVLGPGLQISVLAASGTILTSWRPARQARTHAAIWARTQVMKVPVPYGSSS